MAAPKYGLVTQGYITGHLANGACPAFTYRFRSIYYKWDKKTSSKTDQFKANWIGSSSYQVDGTFHLNLK